MDFSEDMKCLICMKSNSSFFFLLVHFYFPGHAFYVLSKKVFPFQGDENFVLHFPFEVLSL